VLAQKSQPFDPLAFPHHNEQHMPTLDNRLFEAEKINERIGTVLGNRYTYERRVTLPLAYLNLSLDHHRAIILLMRSGLFGSAMALVRPTFEAMIRSHWVAGCATETQVEEIAEKDDFKFPKMDDMTAAVDRVFSDPNDEELTFFQQAKKDGWEAMNSYTHSGLRQLARQFSGDRVESRYPETDLISGVNASTTSVLLHGYLIAKISGQEEAARQLQSLFRFGEP
jgi:hypothetical protein